jgi:hypothetical protein
VTTTTVPIERTTIGRLFQQIIPEDATHAASMTTDVADDLRTTYTVVLTLKWERPFTSGPPWMLPPDPRMAIDATVLLPGGDYVMTREPNGLVEELARLKGERGR